MPTPERLSPGATFTRRVHGKEYSLSLVPDISEGQNRTNQVRFDRLISEVIANRTPVVAIQPHRDDLILSAGGLLHHLIQNGSSVSSLTVMTRADDLVDSSFVRRIWRSDGPSTQYFERRERDDQQAMAKIGIQARHNLGHLDVAYRTKEGTNVPLYEKIRGERAPEDEQLQGEIAQALRAYSSLDKPIVLLGPLGIGGHIDHLLVRNAITEAFIEDPYVTLVFYQDIPYAMDKE